MCRGELIKKFKTITNYEKLGDFIYEEIDTEIHMNKDLIEPPWSLGLLHPHSQLTRLARMSVNVITKV